MGMQVKLICFSKTWLKLRWRSLPRDATIVTCSKSLQNNAIRILWYRCQVEVVPHLDWIIHCMMCSTMMLITYRPIVLHTLCNKHVTELISVLAQIAPDCILQLNFISLNLGWLSPLLGPNFSLFMDPPLLSISLDWRGCSEAGDAGTIFLQGCRTGWVVLCLP